MLALLPNAWSYNMIVTLTLASCICGCSGERNVTNYTDGGGVKILTQIKMNSPDIWPGPDHVIDVVERHHRPKRDADQKTSSPFTSKEKKDLLAKHNVLRSGTKKAADMFMMKWDEDLEKEAQKWADRCDFNHPESTTKTVGEFKAYGQNLYVATNKPSPVTVAVQSWFDEIKDYTYSKDLQCIQGHMCGHYTQVVWAKSYAVGCGIKFCEVLTSVVSFSKGYYVVCNYGPPGNMMGYFPYTSGKSCSKCPKSHKYCEDNLCTNTPSASQPLAFRHDSYTLVAMVTTLVTIAVCFATGSNLLS